MIARTLCKAYRNPHNLALMYFWSDSVYLSSLMLAVFLQPLLGMLCPRSSGWFFLVFWVSCQIPPSQCSFSWLFSWIVHDHGITLLPFLPLSMFLAHFVSFCPKSARFTCSGNSFVFITVPPVLAHSGCVIDNCWVKKRITILNNSLSDI